MSYLFIDSTYDLRLGVLNDELEWLSLEELTGFKASAILQRKSYELLKKFNIAPTELKGIISIVGPGFYTGLRLAEGFANVFSFFGVKEYSFYSYEVPRWCGEKAGTWFTKAYRGEYFLYHWDGENSHQELISVKDLSEKLVPRNYFIHSVASLDSHCESLLPNAKKTTDLLRVNSKKVFTEVLKGERKEPFYFRAPEDEFKVNP